MPLKGPLIDDRGLLLKRRVSNVQVEADVFHSSYYRVSTKARANVVTIHDLMNELFPRHGRDWLLLQLKKRACRRAKAIVVVSETTKNSLLELYPFVDPEQVHVIYNGVDKVFFPDPQDDTFEVAGQALSPRGYLLYVGTRGYCKNFPFVLEVMAEARQQGLDLPLVIVGGGPLSARERAKMRDLGLDEDRMLQLSALSDAQLRLLYSNCLTLLIPSIYEGFGLPAAEAARCGALVLTAKGSALTEIVGKTEFAFDLSRTGEAARVLSLGLDSPFAEDERERMRSRSVMFDWDRSVAQLREIYHGL